MVKPLSNSMDLKKRVLSIMESNLNTLSITTMKQLLTKKHMIKFNQSLKRKKLKYQIQLFLHSSLNREMFPFYPMKLMIPKFY